MSPTWEDDYYPVIIVLFAISENIRMCVCIHKCENITYTYIYIYIFDFTLLRA